CAAAAVYWARSRRCIITPEEVILSAPMEREAVRRGDVQAMICFADRTRVSFYLESRPVPVQLSLSGYERPAELLESLRSWIPPDTVRETTGPDPETTLGGIRRLPVQLAIWGFLAAFSVFLVGP